MGGGGGEEEGEEEEEEEEVGVAARPEAVGASLGLSSSQRLQHSAAMSGGRARLLRAILTSYFAKHAPEGVHKVESLVARVVGGPPTPVEGVGMVGGVLWSEPELFAKLEAKYGARVDMDPQSLE